MMDRETERVILEDYWTEHRATVPISAGNVDSNMGFCNRAELLRAADVSTKMNDPKYRPASIDDGWRTRAYEGCD